MITPQIVHGAPEPSELFAVCVEAKADAHAKVIDFDRRHAWFRYGPDGFADEAAALRTARAWAEQYGVPTIYVH